MKRTERIEQMEQRLERSAESIRELEAAVSAYEAAQDDYYKLLTYYSSAQWMRDYEADEAGKLPADLKRGVLSEDAVYDLLLEHRDLMARLSRLVTRALEEG